MATTEKINSLAKQTIYIVVAHAIIFAIYCYAQGHINRIYAMDSFLPIYVFFCIGPVVMALFLKKESARLCVIALTGTLMAELIYNIYLRFTDSPILAIKEPDLIWQVLYEGTFGIALVLEVIGIYLSIKILKEIHKQIT